MIGERILVLVVIIVMMMVVSVFDEVKGMVVIFIVRMVREGVRS